jgi:hypothetical protein
MAQGIAYPQQIWLQESAFNPAASAFFSTYDAYVGFSILPDITDNYGYYASSGYSGQANFYLPKLNSGFGVSYNSRTNEDWQNWNWEVTDTLFEDFQNLRLNYNYQIEFKNKAVLSLGAAYVAQKRDWKNYVPPCYRCDVPTTGGIRLTGVSLGAIYGTPKWSAGFSVSPVFAFVNETFLYTYFTSEYTMHGSYSFDGGKNTTITPYLYASMTSDYNGFYMPFAVIGLRLEHEWFLFAADFSGQDYGYINGTLGATLWKQFSLIYTGSMVMGYTAGRHTFGVRYNLKK